MNPLSIDNERERSWLSTHTTDLYTLLIAEPLHCWFDHFVSIHMDHKHLHVFVYSQRSVHRLFFKYLAINFPTMLFPSSRPSRQTIIYTDDELLFACLGISVQQSEQIDLSVHCSLGNFPCIMILREVVRLQLSTCRLSLLVLQTFWNTEFTFHASWLNGSTYESPSEEWWKENSAVRLRTMTICATSSCIDLWLQGPFSLIMCIPL